VTPTPAPEPTPEPTPEPSQVTWTRCASEGVAYPGDTCTFSGTRQVRYGVPGAYTYKLTSSSINCSDGAFGVTVPTPYQNFCDYSSESTAGTSPEPAPAPAPEPTPEPTPTPTPEPAPTGAAGPRVGSFSTSGPITASSGQVISGLRISNPNGACVTISGVSGVILRDNEIGPCGGPAVNIVNGASGNTIEHNRVSADIERGIMVIDADGNTVQKNVLLGVRRIGDNKHAIEVTRSDRTNVIGNYFTGAWESDILSGYESSDCRFIDNEFVNVSIDKPSGAAFTIGDSTTGNPGRNNYVARNKVYSQSGGVPAGVFGSNANTILEYNCFAAGIQAYNYSGIFVGVTIRNNVINMSNSFVPDTSVISGWSTNINSTNCSLVP